MGAKKFHVSACSIDSRQNVHSTHAHENDAGAAPPCMPPSSGEELRISTSSVVAVRSSFARISPIDLPYFSGGGVNVSGVHRCHTGHHDLWVNGLCRRAAAGGTRAGRRAEQNPCALWCLAVLCFEDDRCGAGGGGGPRRVRRHARSRTNGANRAFKQPVHRDALQLRARTIVAHHSGSTLRCFADPAFSAWSRRPSVSATARARRVKMTRARIGTCRRCAGRRRRAFRSRRIALLLLRCCSPLR